MGKTRIFLAEDHTLVREGLKMLINTQEDMQVVGEAGDGHLAVQLALKLQPEVVIMDITMPRMNGDKAARQLLKAAPHIRVIALSVHEDRSYLKDLLEAGAAGYILKRSVAEELLSAIRIAANGGVFLDSHLAQKAVTVYLSEGEEQQSLAGKADALSPRENEVVRLIAFGFTNKEVAHQLRIGMKTVETYKTRAMEKLGLYSRVDLVRYALKQGWLNERETEK